MSVSGVFRQFGIYFWKFWHCRINIRTLSLKINVIFTRSKAWERLAQVNFMFYDNVIILHMIATNSNDTISQKWRMQNGWHSRTATLPEHMTITAVSSGLHSLVFCVVFCRSLCVRLPLRCLFFFDLRLLIHFGIFKLFLKFWVFVVYFFICSPIQWKQHLMVLIKSICLLH